ncbi:hypothetical protein K438DRAFT_2111369 [Mycena galopus ATCC 62051]|nr:hypothetical protein K438DRAFT_2111369 [Mycena galopus ATCC 62051]
MSRAALAGYFHNLHELQNASHYFNYCKGCVLHQKKLLQDAGTYDETEWQAEGQSFIDACHAAGSVRGDKGPWITHILGGKGTTACTHVTDAARQEARVHKNIEDAKKTGKQSGLPVVAGGATLLAEASTSQKHGRSMSSSALDVPGPKRLKQGFFQVFTGKDQPFSPAETEEIQAQVLRATISAGMPFRVWENPEVLRLIGMFRSAGPAIIPSRKVVGGRLLNEAAGKVEVEVNLALQGREIGLVSDGWKSRKKANVNGLCANTYTLELVDATAIGKDGPTLCKLFGDMIDRVELKHRCYVIFFGTDADGGSKKGRVLLGKQRPWLFVPSCWAHQFQLILGDYFKVYPYAAEISEQATGLIGWINNHGKVRVIFDNAQRELSPDRVGRILILAYLVANLTRWTTHCIAFLRLLILQEYLQFAVLRDRGAIIAAQVGAAQYTEATNGIWANTPCFLFETPANQPSKPLSTLEITLWRRCRWHNGFLCIFSLPTTLHLPPMSDFVFVSENETFGATPSGADANSASPPPAAGKYRKNFRWGEYTAPDQNPTLKSRSLAADVPISHLKINKEQRKFIEAMYRPDSGASLPAPPIVDYIYGLDDDAQLQASAVMAQHGLAADSREDLGNRWSHQWSRHSEKAKVDTQKILYLCACGYDHRQHNTKYDRSEYETPGTQERQTAAPFTGCLAHAELTVRGHKILRIRGHFEHNPECKTANFSRTPPIPVHPSVYVAALAQLRDGATFSDIRQKNRDLFEAKAYADFPADITSSPYRWLLSF